MLPQSKSETHWDSVCIGRLLWAPSRFPGVPSGVTLSHYATTHCLHPTRGNTSCLYTVTPPLLWLLGPSPQGDQHFSFLMDREVVLTVYILLPP